MFEEAIAEYQKMEEETDIIWAQTTRAYVYALGGKEDKTQKTYEELKKLSQQRYIDASYLAVLSAALGDKDEAFEWLDKALEERSVLMVYLENYAKSWFGKISSDPRFKNLLEKVGFDQ
jgi:tetratricopeptide (TPR) repeat protein